MGPGSHEEGEGKDLMVMYWLYQTLGNVSCLSESKGNDRKHFGVRILEVRTRLSHDQNHEEGRNDGRRACRVFASAICRNGAQCPCVRRVSGLWYHFSLSLQRYRRDSIVAPFRPAVTQIPRSRSFRNLSLIHI